MSDVAPRLLRVTVSTMSLLEEVDRVRALAYVSGLGSLTHPLRAAILHLEDALTELGAAARLMEDPARSGGPGGGPIPGDPADQGAPP